MPTPEETIASLNQSIAELTEETERLRAILRAQRGMPVEEAPPTEGKVLSFRPGQYRDVVTGESFVVSHTAKCREEVGQGEEVVILNDMRLKRLYLVPAKSFLADRRYIRLGI